MIQVASHLDPVTKALKKRCYDAGEAAARSCEPCELLM